MNDQRIKVLLVDDDEDYWVITRSLLAESKDVHYELDWIAAYDAALETIKLNKHDIYLLDYRIGSHTGLDLLSMALENGCKAPFIMLTGQGDRKTDVKAMQMGAADYLSKDKIDAALLDRSVRYAI
ncbi:MAG: response regulator [Elusimicrobiota bacterium]